MVRIEVRGINCHEDNFVVVVEEANGKDAATQLDKALGQVKWGDYSLKVPAAPEA